MSVLLKFARSNDYQSQDLCFLGQTTLGIYRDDCEGLSPDDIEEYYGVDGPERARQPHQSGARHPMDEAGLDEDLYVHEAVHAPISQSPFLDDDKEAQFYAVLQEVIKHDITPENFGLTHGEWEDSHYPIYESILVGRRAGKELHVSLAEPIWYDRARLWCQALATLSHFGL